MSVSEATIAVVLVGCIILIYRLILHPAYLSPLARIKPVHPLCCVTSRWFQAKVEQRRPYSTIRAAHTKLGPLIRIGPNEICVASREGLRAVYTAGLARDSSYSFFESYDTPNLMSFTDSKAHSEQKRLISAVYARSYLQVSKDMKILTREIIGERFLPKLTRLSREALDCDVMMLSQLVGMDMVTAYMFGLDNGTNWLTYQAEADRYLAGVHTYRDPAVLDKYSETLCLQMCNNTLSTLRGERVSRTRPVVFEKLHESGSRSKSSHHDQVSDRVASEMMDQMHAAHKPISVILTYAVWHLSRDAELQTRLRQEFGMLRPRLLPDVQEGDDFELPSASDVNSLPLLNCILLETLRLYAPVAGLQTRVVPSPGIVLHDTFIPAGTIISSNAYTLHRDEAVFPDAHLWLPGRWTQVIEDKRSPRAIEMRGSFWAFGSGGKMCLGNNFAQQLLKVCLVSIYSHHSTSIINDEGIEQEESSLAKPRSNRLIVRLHRVDV